MRGRRGLLIASVILVAVVIQTTLFGQIRFITPDLVMLVAILLALTRVRPEGVLGLAFGAGLLVDLVGSSLLGLRAVVFTSVAYVALRTRERADLGRITMALWAGGLTFVGVVMLLLVGALFGQTSLLGENTLGRLFLVPITNLVIAGMVTPAFVRLIDRDATALRYS